MPKYSLRYFLFLAAIYLIGAIFLFPVLRYYIDYADTFSYIAIAEKYAAGNFSDAVNGTWSPMISWILSLLIFTKADVFLLYKILEVIASLVGLYLTASLIEKLRIRNALALLLQLSFVPCFLSFALLWSTPDLLFLDILLFIHLVFFDFNGLNQRRAYVIGIAGALLYFAKAYGIFYFPVFCVFGYSIFYWHEVDKDQRRRILLNAVKSISVFVFLSAIWITAISVKYQRLTVSDAVSYNENISPSANQTVVHPVISSGLSDPRIHHSMFAWEDPMLYNTNYGIQAAPFDLHKKIKTFERNISSYYYYQYRNQIGWLFVISLLLAMIFLKRKWLSYPVALLVFTVLLFPSAYFFVLIVHRYVWIVTILMGISIIYISQLLIEHKKGWMGWTLAILCFLLVIKRPIKEVLWRQDTAKSVSELTYGVTHFKTTLMQTYGQDAAIFAMTDSLRNRTDLKGIVASFTNRADHPRESYPLSLIVCHYLDNPYFGQLSRSILEKEKLQQLFERKVDFYYVWMNDSLNDELTKPFPVVYENKDAGLRIFKVDGSQLTVHGNSQ